MTNRAARWCQPRVLVITVWPPRSTAMKRTSDPARWALAANEWDLPALATRSARRAGRRAVYPAGVPRGCRVRTRVPARPRPGRGAACGGERHPVAPGAAEFAATLARLGAAEAAVPVQATKNQVMPTLATLRQEAPCTAPARLLARAAGSNRSTTLLTSSPRSTPAPTPRPPRRGPAPARWSGHTAEARPTSPGRNAWTGSYSVALGTLSGSRVAVFFASSSWSPRC